MKAGLGVGVVSVAALAALSGCGGSPASSPTSPSATPPSGSCEPGTPALAVPSLTARLVASGLRNPLDLQAAPGDRERLYVVEQGGRIRTIRNGELQPAPFLDVSGRISSGGERGLLGLAFHPRFATNRRFFVNYTDPRGDTRVAEFRATSADAADAGSERVLLAVPQPFANHNGGGLAFDASGRLLVALGDGGSGGDPLGNGQRLDTLLGKILRLDVDAGTPYAVPPDNPFRSTAGARPEIWAYGLRNPFRIAVDLPTGDLYIGDVGQGEVEEIDVGLASRRGGENYGWNVTEGSRCYNPASGCDRSGLTLPVYEYTHAEGCSVTGGVVYRGCRMPALAGTYFFADFCSGLVRSIRFAGGQATEVRDWTAGLRGVDSPTSFGVDGEGEVYVVDYDGEVFRLEPQ
ncbi:MAG TPA: PQQ-dependent sugar dehydrogenase [Vicinamibacteria bacterium]|nr:PQQ-dependent sugar dehydrogenase [Vicinamibacteria bacterium]